MARAGACSRLWLLAAGLLFAVGPGAAKDNVNKLSLSERPKQTVRTHTIQAAVCAHAEVHAALSGYSEVSLPSE